MAPPHDPLPRVEVCVDSLAGVRAAARAGADRVELCAELARGGVTPSAGLIRASRAAARIELVVLVRPRAGDFLYTPEELATMRADVQFAGEAGADGVALGVLTADGAIDRARTAELIALARPMRVTFHRAFDLARDPLSALDVLLELGADRLLSSGQAATAAEGLPLLRELVTRARGRLTVMPGCGVRPHNAARILTESGARELHFSASAEVESAMRWRHTGVAMGAASGDEYRRRVPDEARVLDVLAALGRGAGGAGA